PPSLHDALPSCAGTSGSHQRADPASPCTSTSAGAPRGPSWCTWTPPPSRCSTGSPAAPALSRDTATAFAGSSPAVARTAAARSQRRSPGRPAPGRPEAGRGPAPFGRREASDPEASDPEKEEADMRPPSPPPGPAGLDECSPGPARGGVFDAAGLLGAL